MQVAAPPVTWIPSEDEWITASEADELVAALRQLISELIGWGEVA